jgi:hypothetical protein
LCKSCRINDLQYLPVVGSAACFSPKIR